MKQVYSALLDGQIENAISIEDGYSADLYPAVRPYIIAMPIIQGVAALILAWFTYKLFRDFGWEVLHLIGADRKLKVGLNDSGCKKSCRCLLGSWILPFCKLLAAADHTLF